MSQGQIQTEYLLTFFWKMGHSRPLFIFFRLFNRVDIKRSIYILPMSGFKPQTSGVRRDYTTNWAPTTASRFTLEASALTIVPLHFKLSQNNHFYKSENWLQKFHDI